MTIISLPILKFLINTTKKITIPISNDILSNYSYTADSGLFLYFLNFLGQPSFYTEL